MYEAALAELGFVVLSEGAFEGDAYVLFGRGDRDDFCLHTVGSNPGRDRVTTGAHIAFCATDAGAVVRWHEAAVHHGGTDMDSPVYGPSTAAITTPRSFSILTATMSRRGSTHQHSHAEEDSRICLAQARADLVHVDDAVADRSASRGRASSRHGKGGLVLVSGDPDDARFEVGPGIPCRVDLR